MSVIGQKVSCTGHCVGTVAVVQSVGLSGQAVGLIGHIVLFCGHMVTTPIPSEHVVTNAVVAALHNVGPAFAGHLVMTLGQLVSMIG